MAMHAAKNIFNRYTADPEQRDYQLLSALFLLSGETPQEVMTHGEEWVGGLGRIELMTVVAYCPNFVELWYEACCIGFRQNKPLHMTWRVDGNEWWEPSMGPEQLDARCTCTMDDSGERTQIKIVTPVVDLPAMAAFSG